MQAQHDGHAGCAPAGLAKAMGKLRGSISVQIKLIFVTLGCGCRASPPLGSPGC